MTHLAGEGGDQDADTHLDSVTGRPVVRTCVRDDRAQGSAYTRFKRALKSGNAHLALDAAAELQRMGLADALSLLLLIREDKPVLYEKAAVRWFAKYAA